MHPARVSCRVNHANRLVKQVKAEAEERRQREVARKAFRALVHVIDQALEGHGATEEYCVPDPTDPRRC